MNNKLATEMLMFKDMHPMSESCACYFGIQHHHASWIRFLVVCLQHQPSCPPSSSKVRGFVLVMERARSFTGKAEAGSASRVDPGVVMIK